MLKPRHTLTHCFSLKVIKTFYTIVCVWYFCIYVIEDIWSFSVLPGFKQGFNWQYANFYICLLIIKKN